VVLKNQRQINHQRKVNVMFANPRSKCTSIYDFLI